MDCDQGTTTPWLISNIWSILVCENTLLTAWRRTTCNTVPSRTTGGKAWWKAYCVGYISLTSMFWLRLTAGLKSHYCNKVRRRHHRAPEVRSFSYQSAACFRSVYVNQRALLLDDLYKGARRDLWRVNYYGNYSLVSNTWSSVNPRLSGQPPHHSDGVNVVAHISSISKMSYKVQLFSTDGVVRLFWGFFEATCEKEEEEEEGVLVCRFYGL